MQEWRIKDILGWTTRFFAEKGIDSARLEAEVLLARVLHKNRVYLYANYDAPVNRDERKKYREAIKRRIKGEPLAYIVGCREFMSLEFEVTPAVLIPRPETELLVETALEILQDQENTVIGDVGTGSGAIGVSVAWYKPDARVYATDISNQALAVARRNADRHGVKIEFAEGYLMDPWPNHVMADMIIANLPYIGSDEYNNLAPGVKEFEPRQALLVPGDGLDLYRQLIPQVRQILKGGGHLLFEIGFNQGPAAAALMEGFDEVETVKDLAGHDRVIKGRKVG
ncbi:peptide chain release factor N(5)-glutamine methyltransferase [Syntrophomonas erecta]